MRPLMRVMGLGFSLLGACQGASGSTKELSIDVLVESDPGWPMADVAIEVDGREVGATGSDGTVRTTVGVEPGALVTLGHRCPPGFIGESRPRTLRVRRAPRLDELRRVTLRLQCRPEARVAVFLIRTEGRHAVDVFIDGEWVADTGSDGVAHLSRRASAGTEFLVELVPRRQGLRPARITRVFTVPDSDEIFVFEQSFRASVAARGPPQLKPRIRRIE